MIEAHLTARISDLADLEASVRGSKYVIGENSVIDSFVKFKPAGGSGDIVIGRNCTINSGCVFYSGHGITIGDNVLIAANCTLAPVNHEFRDKSRPIREQGFQESRGGIVIEDDVWLGANCVLLDGTILRKGCVIAAGSIVRGTVEAYSITGGNPLRTLGYRS
ncbi:acyltransferase [Ensifer sp. T173]|jgi:acetyltransferase-like isoleucine patch superfamily enzyme|uniref:Acyltransferase n=1 Tax=Ensifer canadensis TaxID=555315 RepID=A0AAW4FK07_9HYPH|nr:acyltransferase [Ensifer canadensis]AHK45162.1 putative acetyltransferase protein [Ensifer adhaerens OV14]KQW46124.1 acetyltransferase [Ensifer sp. Root1252]KQW83431.1 acetyltransferase [Ensifer sp. Root127]KQY65935.1 acetyltransferase [Ensifer sp. Root142]KRC75915.1 acetyltransferase [Ensifer sp. Root231]KRC93805.1 acetyltransferase [Ensifer sp. Root258]MBD9492076.1 acyltransferase [Ensifer sp. ENS11]OMQ43969.1 acetyltransferase [Ensifer sp. 1H6]PSS59593.1 acetyltransferase [Ensifer sp